MNELWAHLNTLNDTFPPQYLKEIITGFVFAMLVFFCGLQFGAIFKAFRIGADDT